MGARYTLLWDLRQIKHVAFKVPIILIRTRCMKKSKRKGDFVQKKITHDPNVGPEHRHLSSPEFFKESRAAKSIIERSKQ